MSKTKEEYAEILYQNLIQKYEEKEKEISSDFMRKLERYILFEVVDNRWREHLKALDGLRESIYLRAYGQRDPIVEYKLISGQIFEQMIKNIQEQTTSYLFKIVIKEEEEKTEVEEEVKEMGNSKKEIKEGTCSCGSGKLFEKCCGR